VLQNVAIAVLISVDCVATMSWLLQIDTSILDAHFFDAMRREKDLSLFVGLFHTRAFIFQGARSFQLLMYCMNT